MRVKQIHHLLFWAVPREWSAPHSTGLQHTTPHRQVDFSHSRKPSSVHAAESISLNVLQSTSYILCVSGELPVWGSQINGCSYQGSTPQHGTRSPC